MKTKRPQNKRARRPAPKVKGLRLNDLLDPGSCPSSGESGVSGEDRLSADALKRFESIPLLGRHEPPVRTHTGRVTYDTWGVESTASLRDAAPGHIRRVTLRAGKLVFELVAERRKTDWEFVGRIYDGNQIRHDFVLRAGKNRVLPRSGGFYRWNSGTVPRLVRLNSYQQEIAFEELAW